MEFARVVSLGALCEAAYQIRRRYGVTPFNPFDWIGAPLSSISSILADDGRMLGHEIEVRGDSAICKHYGVNYYHEFHRDEDRSPVITDRSLTVCKRKLRRKYLHLINRLDDDQPTLFIRLHGHHDSAAAEYLTPDPRPLLTSEINDLVHCLERKFPRLPFRVAFVKMSGVTKLINDAPPDPRILFHEIPPFSLWQGNNDAWDEIFDTYSVITNEIPHPDVTKEYLHP